MTVRTFCALACLIALLSVRSAAFAQSSAGSPRMTLIPAVVILKAKPGQTVTQAITLNNQTENAFSFVMQAEDVDVKTGKRVFVPAGELHASIASSAVYSQRSGTIEPFSQKTVTVLLTVPERTNLRAVVVYFKNTQEGKSPGTITLTASLGSLITFVLSNDFSLRGEAVHVHPATASENLRVTQLVVNDGTEPIVPQGLVAFVESNGTLAAKVPFQGRRLLPGERLEFEAPYSGTLKPGLYRVVCTFSYEGKSLTTTAEYRQR